MVHIYCAHAMFEDTYLTIESFSEGLYKEKGSRFIALAYPVTNEQAVKEILAELRKTYHDARHHCYAYVVGFDKSTFRFNDDGEPTGTAGRPIYGQILSADLTNVLVVVVRYFGGVLLGAAGLSRAYKAAAKDAFDKAQVVERTVNEVYRICFDYAAMNNVMKCLKDNEAAFLSQSFESQPEIVFSIRKMMAGKVYDTLKKTEGVTVTYEKTV